MQDDGDSDSAPQNHRVTRSLMPGGAIRTRNDTDVRLLTEIDPRPSLPRKYWHQLRDRLVWRLGDLPLELDVIPQPFQTADQMLGDELLFGSVQIGLAQMT